jgi:DNA-binding transcriptional MerR regulator
MKRDRKDSADAELMRISQAAAAGGVSPQTVEYYIMLGLIEPIRRPGKRGRYFQDTHVKRIRLIRQLNQSGYTLRSIRETYLRQK